MKFKQSGWYCHNRQRITSLHSLFSQTLHQLISVIPAQSYMVITNESSDNQKDYQYIFTQSDHVPSYLQWIIWLICFCMLWFYILKGRCTIIFIILCQCWMCVVVIVYSCNICAASHRIMGEYSVIISKILRPIFQHDNTFPSPVADKVLYEP